MPDAGRVITGSARSIRLAAPGEGTRPFSDKVKQALFASLEATLDDPWSGDLLDLFAGSGAGGIEALSRGAARAVLVEDDAHAARTIAENLRRTRCAGGIVVRRDAIRFLEAGSDAAGDGHGPFAIVLADPAHRRLSVRAREVASGMIGVSGGILPGHESFGAELRDGWLRRVGAGDAVAGEELDA